MKSLILGLSLVSLGAFGAEKPLENNGRDVENYEAAQAAVKLVEYFGYRCDSISSFRKAVFSAGEFTLNCNNFRYSYEIKDKGGRWTVTVN